MSIINFPNRPIRNKPPAIDRVLAKRNVLTTMGSQNVFSTALDVDVSCNDAWLVDSIGWSFNNANSRTFSAFIANGRKVVADLNDYLWIWALNLYPQRIILNAGFYTGTELATELQRALNANPDFIRNSLTFTVSYTSGTGLYLITPSSGTLKYLQSFQSAPNAFRDSIAGPLFGFTASTASFSATLTSNTTVFGLDSEVAIVSQTGSTATSYSHVGPETLGVDQALHLTSNAGADVTLTYTIAYEELV